MPPVPRYGGFYASTTYISLCDVDEAEPDTLSHTCDRVSEAGQMLQGGACAIWHKVTRIADIEQPLTGRNLIKPTDLFPK